MRWAGQHCGPEHLVLFYPGPQETPSETMLREHRAAQVCAGCPVLRECLAAEFAETPKAEAIDGWRAGMPATARQRLYREHHGLAKGERRPMRKVA